VIEVKWGMGIMGTVRFSHEKGLKLPKNRYFPENGCFSKKGIHLLPWAFDEAFPYGNEVSPECIPSLSPNLPRINGGRLIDVISRSWSFNCLPPP